MAVSATCTGAFTTETGRYYVTIQGLGQMEFQNLQELLDWGNAADDASQTTLAAQFLVKSWIAQNGGTDLAAMVGKKLTIDLTGMPSVVFIQQVG